MDAQQLKDTWNNATPARRIEMGASEANSRKVWDALTVLQQMIFWVQNDGQTVDH